MRSRRRAEKAGEKMTRRRLFRGLRRPGAPVRAAVAKAKAKKTHHHREEEGRRTSSVHQQRLGGKSVKTKATGAGRRHHGFRERVMEEDREKQYKVRELEIPFRDVASGGPDSATAPPLAEGGCATLCPADGRCEPDGDCSGCRGGLTKFNPRTARCMAPRPQRSYDFCGREPGSGNPYAPGGVDAGPGLPPERCDAFVTGIVGCQMACSMKVGYKLNPGIYGSCIRGFEAGCPAANCREICECPSDGAVEGCRQPCMEHCSRYVRCVIHGSGGRATTAADFDAHFEQCVLQKPPTEATLKRLRKAGHQGPVEIQCGCAPESTPV